ncbi:MAG: hypothetical protein AB7I24_16305 [Candidatus Nanopelagicales bacterium]
MDEMLDAIELRKKVGRFRCTPPAPPSAGDGDDVRDVKRLERLTASIERALDSCAAGIAALAR